MGKNAGGVGRHWPGSVLPVKVSGFAGNEPSLARFRMMLSAACCADCDSGIVNRAARC